MPKDAWEWALVERLGPGEVAPLERGTRVLADTRPGKAKPWTTIVLLGTDEGPGNVGARTDTIILVAGAARHRPRGRVRGAAQPRPGAARYRREAVPGAAERALRALAAAVQQGATALKQAVSNLLGLRVDYYALVNLLGFADLVDALGGVEIDVKERLVDEVTRPAWGERKPRIDVVPGRTYRFYGREALAYVRSRKRSNDYTRMARQRCFLSAMADQLDPVRVLRNFGSLAKTIETNVHTDIPLEPAPEPDPARQRGRPARDADGHVRARLHLRPPARTGNYPVPHLGRIQSDCAERDPQPRSCCRENGKAKTGRSRAADAWT